MKNTDFDQLNHELQEAPWHVGDIFTDVDDKYDYWNALFGGTVNVHAPTRRKRVRAWNGRTLHDLKLETAIRKKRKYAILFAKNRTPENMELKRKYRNIATRERRKAIMEYWFAKWELKSKPSEFYNAFRPFINSKTKESALISLQTEESIVVQDQFEVAEQLVNYVWVYVYVYCHGYRGMKDSDARLLNRVKRGARFAPKEVVIKNSISFP